MEHSARRASRAGFVLVGGTSSRMGRDKALLPRNGVTLLEHVARVVEAAAGSVTLAGEPERYQGFGYPVIADLHPGCGPLGGIAAALEHSEAAWNLIVACDMPALTAGFLRSLFDQAEKGGCACLIPVSPLGIEPLCAVYHRECRAGIGQAIRRRVFKVQDAIAGLHARYWEVPQAAWFANMNTPGDWTHYCATRAPQPE